MMSEPGSLVVGGLDAVGLALLHSLWQGSLVALLYLLVCGVALRGLPAWRVRVGEISLLAALIWPVMTLAWTLGAGESLLPVARQAVQTVQAALVESGSIAEASWMQWVAKAWIAGVILLGVRAAWHWRQLRRVIATAVPVADAWQARVNQLCAALGIKRSVRWLESGLVETPMMLGWIKPVVLFPAGLCMRLPQDQVELLLLHELAHVRRLDGLGNALQITVETLLFFNPAVRWMSRRIRHDRELACDLMIGDQPARRLRYAKALLALAEHRHGDAGWAMAATGGVLGARIDYLLLGRTEASWYEGRRAVWAAGMLAIGMLLASFGAKRVSELPLPLEAAFDLGLRRAGLIQTDPLQVLDWQAPRLSWTVPQSMLNLDSGMSVTPPVELPALSRTRAAISNLSLSDVSQPLGGISRTPEPLPATRPSATVTTSEVLNIKRPEYPRYARRRGVEGWVELSFVVDAQGVPHSIESREAQPTGVFEQAAREALQQWRFDTAVAGQQRVQRFDFALSGQQSESRRFGACETPTGTRICRDHADTSSDAYPVTVIGMSR